MGFVFRLKKDRLFVIFIEAITSTRNPKLTNKEVKTVRIFAPLKSQKLNDSASRNKREHVQGHQGHVPSGTQPQAHHSQVKHPQVIPPKGRARKFRNYFQEIETTKTLSSHL